MMIKVIPRTIDRKWGWVLVYDVYSDDVLVAIIDGGHYDLTHKPNISVAYDSDGDMYYEHTNGDFQKAFEMPKEVLELCKAHTPLKTWVVRDMGKTVAGPFLTQDVAYAARLSFNKWASVERIEFSHKM